VARNPRLANPEISKIIGEQWKAEDDDIKKVWQDLAEVGYRSSLLLLQSMLTLVLGREAQASYAVS